MLKRFQIFLGPRHFRALLALLGVTGLASLALSVFSDGGEGALILQTLLLAAFVLGAAALIMSRLPSEEQKRWLAIIVPSLLLMALGSLVAPHLSGIFIGAGCGWIVAGIFIFRNITGPRQYRLAIKAMRKGDYAQAIAAMTEHIKNEPDRAEHYRFRAELHRLAGNIKAARRDYQRMTALDSESAVAYNGLAEVALQAGRFDEARVAAERAFELAPAEWVAAYNLGMIEDRLSASDAAITHTQRALEAGIPDSRHRLLAQLYLWRAFKRLGDSQAVAESLAALRRERAGLEEWQVIMSAEEAVALRDVLSEDIEQARQLITGEKPERR